MRQPVDAGVGCADAHEPTQRSRARESEALRQWRRSTTEMARVRKAACDYLLSLATSDDASGGHSAVGELCRSSSITPKAASVTSRCARIMNLRQEQAAEFCPGSGHASAARWLYSAKLQADVRFDGPFPSYTADTLFAHNGNLSRASCIQR